MYFISPPLGQYTSLLGFLIGAASLLSSTYYILQGAGAYQCAHVCETGTVSSSSSAVWRHASSFHYTPPPASSSCMRIYSWIFLASRSPQSYVALSHVVLRSIWSFRILLLLLFLLLLLLLCRLLLFLILVLQSVTVSNEAENLLFTYLCVTYSFTYSFFHYFFVF